MFDFILKIIRLFFNSQKDDNLAIKDIKEGGKVKTNISIALKDNKGGAMDNLRLRRKDIITEEQFSEIFPRAKKEFVDIIKVVLPLNEIDTLERVSAFLAQCGHESGNFTVFIENLNYSAEGLLKVFSKYFNTETAKEYARKPEKIANRVYANRMGNGDEQSGDGWRYRGRGLIQLTGKSNYIKYAKYCDIELEDAVKLCETMEGICDSAVFFWNSNNCNKFCDLKDFRGLTKTINGGYNGLDHRIELYELLKNALKENFE